MMDLRVNVDLRRNQDARKEKTQQRLSSDDVDGSHHYCEETIMTAADYTPPLTPELHQEEISVRKLPTTPSSSCSSNKKRLIVIGVVVIFVSVLLCSWHPPISLMADDEKLLAAAASAGGSYRRCTFEDLYRVFPPPPAARRWWNRRSKCWNFNNELIRIPVSAIANRNNLTKLGQGNFGGVYHALIQLDGDRRYCSVALKTDHCYHVDPQEEDNVHIDDDDDNATTSSVDGPTKNETTSSVVNNVTTSTVVGPIGSVPCVADAANVDMEEEGIVSYMGGEYTGAFLHYVARRHGLNNDGNNIKRPTAAPGLLPTWAVVVRYKEFSLWNYIPWSKAAQDPIESMVGAIIPFVDFKPLKRVSYNLTAQRAARLVLPAVYGLEFAHSLGLVHQDVLTKNIGIQTSTSDETGEQEQTSFLYDFTFLAKLGECRNTRLCDFCPDSRLSQVKRVKNHPQGPTDPFKNDVHNLAKTIGKRFNRDDNFVADVKNRTDLTDLKELIRILERYAK